MSTKAAPAPVPEPMIQRSDERAYFDHGWLQTDHSFSFADYFDPNNTHWGSLRVFNDDVVAAGKGFGTHPHSNMEILTYVLEGELEHEDSMGNVGVVRPGGVQYLSAGTGLSHSESNHSSERPVHFVQMWVVPRERNLAPAYGQVEFAVDDRRNRWLTVASGEAGVEAPIEIFSDSTLFVSRLEDGQLTKSLAEGRFGFVFVASGELKLGTEKLGAGDSARIVGPFEIALGGSGEVLVWDLSQLPGKSFA